MKGNLEQSIFVHIIRSNSISLQNTFEKTSQSILTCFPIK